jgi:CDP-6-deoxy-D-xylo-4-hexulose-3-dehydrase
MKNNILREDLDAVIDHLSKDDPILTNGPKVKEFEVAWSKWLGVKYSVFVNSGASANLVSIALLKILYPDGGEIIVPPLTWVSDVASILQNGFKPIFVDINLKTLAMDTEKIIAKINKDTVAVFLTHAQGFNALDDNLINYLKKNNIKLIEDVCESHGACHKDKKAGSYGFISNFSFYYAHHMSTIEGGMICTNDYDTYQKLRILRSHGMVREADDEELKKDWINTNPSLNPDFIFAYPAYNVRNNEIGGILGLSQLKRLDHIVTRRNENLLCFLENINDKFFRDFKLEGMSNYAFNLVLNEEDDNYFIKLMSKMKEEGIEFRRGSAGGGNQLRQPYLKNLFPEGYHLNFPVTDHVHFYGAYIGNFPDLQIPEVKLICKIINKV